MTHEDRFTSNLTLLYVWLMSSVALQPENKKCSVVNLEAGGSQVDFDSY